MLLADEPTGNLDEETRDEIMDLLEGLWRDRGLTLIVVTHDSAVAKRAQRRLHIKHGEVKERRLSRSVRRESPSGLSRRHTRPRGDFRRWPVVR